MRGGDWCTGARLSWLPAQDDITKLVCDVRHYWASRGLDPFHPAQAFTLLGWQIRYRSLAVAGCQHRAMLVPLLTGGFVVLVDESLAEQTTTTRCGSVTRRVLTHELAHTFFYSAAAPPERLLALEPEEERFCDSFAEEMYRQQVDAA